MARFCFLVIILFSFTGIVNGQKRDCEQLLAKELVYQDRTGFWQEFVKLKGCGIDSIDVNVFGKASYLNYIYNKFDAEKKKVTYKDLLKEIQTIKKTHDYLNVRNNELKDAAFLKKLAKKENWSEDKKYLEGRGFTATELKAVYEIIEEQEKPVNYETILLLFQAEQQ